MDRPNLRSIGLNDFIRWEQEQTLLLSPKFQRRRMWPPKARAFLIDTIMRGLPIPKVYMRQHLDTRTSKTIHEVVDGQQRLAAVVDFRQDKFHLPEDDSEHSGRTYSQLSPGMQKAFLTYEFSVDLLIGASDADVLGIFARINSYAVPLNAQEKRNAKFFGSFKSAMYELGYRHLEFWRKHGILTDKTIARMREVELTSELVVAMCAGLQDKKKSLDTFYKRWDDRFPIRKKMASRFAETMDLIEKHVGDLLTQSAFRRAALFYSLFLVVYEMRFGRLEGERPEPKIGTSNDFGKLSRAIRSLDGALRARETPSGYVGFVRACERQTDNVSPRRIRREAILRELARVG